MFLKEFDVTLEVRDEAMVAVRRAAIPLNIVDPAGALRSALDAPTNFPALRRAITPDDRIAIVVDDHVPAAGTLVGALLEYLVDAGVSPMAITLVSAPGSRQTWVNDLPDSVQDVRTEIHDPNDRKAVSYLASTKKGRRVYVNRTVVESDQAIILSSCRYDPELGHFGAADAMFPTMSDAATRSEMVSHPNRIEAAEVAWLLGVPFLVQVIDGSGDGVAHIWTGTFESSSNAEQLLAERWKIQCDRRAQTVVATMTGDSAQHDFDTLARAALAASNVVEPGGRIVLLTHADPELGEAVQSLRQSDDVADAVRTLERHAAAADATAARHWIQAANRARLYLLSDLPENTVEELFATPMQQARQTQRLIDAAGSCLFIQDAHQTLVMAD